MKLHAADGCRRPAAVAVRVWLPVVGRRQRVHWRRRRPAMPRRARRGRIERLGRECRDEDHRRSGRRHGVAVVHGRGLDVASQRGLRLVWRGPHWGRVRWQRGRCPHARVRGRVVERKRREPAAPRLPAHGPVLTLCGRAQAFAGMAGESVSWARACRAAHVPAHLDPVLPSRAARRVLVASQWRSGDKGLGWRRDVRRHVVVVVRITLAAGGRCARGVSAGDTRRGRCDTRGACGVPRLTMLM